MGKASRSLRQRLRDRPHPTAAPEENEVDALRHQLTHSDPAAREKALVALLNLNVEQSEKAAQQLLSPDVLSSILKALSDPLQTVRLTALSVIIGLLQIPQRVEVLLFFLQHGLLAALADILQEIETQLGRFLNQNGPKPVIDYVSFIKTVAALLENILDELIDSEDQLQEVAQCQASRWLVQLLLSDSLILPEVAQACCQYTYALVLAVPESRVLILPSLELLESRLVSVTPNFAETQAYTAGIIYNAVQGDQALQPKGEHLVLGFFGKLLEIDCVSEFHANLAPIVNHFYEQKAPLPKASQDDTSTVAEEEEKLAGDVQKAKNSEHVVKQWRQALHAQLVALEVLADLLATPGQDIPEEEQEWEDMEDEAEAPPLGVACDEKLLKQVAARLQFAGFEDQLLTRVWEHSAYREKMLFPILALKMNAAQTLANIMLFHQVPGGEAARLAIAQDSWGFMLQTAELACKSGEDGIVGSMFGLLKSIAEHPRLKGKMKLDCSTEQLQFIAEVLTDAGEGQAQIAGVGLLGSLLAQRVTSLEENEVSVCVLSRKYGIC